jgi:hypothetical protein
MVEAGSGDIITVNPGEVHDGAPIDVKARARRRADPLLQGEMASPQSSGLLDELPPLGCQMPRSHRDRVLRQGASPPP